MRRLTDRLPLVWPALVAAALITSSALPAQAIDTRKLQAGLIPTRAAVSAPDGASGLCARYDWACARTGTMTVMDAAAMALVQQVNQTANRKVRPVSDQSQYATAEKWALPTARGGDCEDYALLKKKLLVQAGFSPDQLLIATVLDRQRKAHAVLVLRTGSQDLVLDNMTNRIRPWRETGYSFLRLQDPKDPARWVAVLAGGIFGPLG